MKEKSNSIIDLSVGGIASAVVAALLLTDIANKESYAAIAPIFLAGCSWLIIYIAEHCGFKSLAVKRLENVSKRKIKKLKSAIADPDLGEEDRKQFRARLADAVSEDLSIEDMIIRKKDD